MISCCVSLNSVNKMSNLWTSLLKESSKRSQVPEATCIVLGDQNSGKKQFIQSLTTFANAGLCEVSDPRKELVGFSYFDIDDGYLESQSRVNLWCFDSHIFNKSFEIIGESNLSDKILFLIVLDLAKPGQCLTSLNIWLTNVATYIRHYYTNTSTDNIQVTKLNNEQYLKAARSSKGEVLRQSRSDASSQSSLSLTPTKKSQPNGFDEKFEFITEYFSLPIVVVGTKCDIINVNDGISMKRARELQGQLRAICLDVGAALVYTSSVNETNVVQLKKYILHRLYPEDIPVEGGLVIEDRVDSTFIPAGFDTTELISIASGSTTVTANSNVFKTNFAQNLKQSISEFNKVATEPTAVPAPFESIESETIDPTLEIESEQEWLTGLHSFVQQANATGNAGTGPVSKLSSNLSDPSLAQSGGNTPDNEAVNGVSSVPEGESKRGITSVPSTANVLSAVATGNTAPSTARHSRRTSSVATGAAKPAAAGDDVSDFFKNLMK